MRKRKRERARKKKGGKEEKKRLKKKVSQEGFTLSLSPSLLPLPLSAPPVWKEFGGLGTTGKERTLLHLKK